jgi:hypothetical protein
VGYTLNYEVTSQILDANNNILMESDTSVPVGLPSGSYSDFSITLPNGAVDTPLNLIPCPAPPAPPAPVPVPSADFILLLPSNTGVSVKLNSTAGTSIPVGQAFLADSQGVTGIYLSNTNTIPVSVRCVLGLKS